jgi:hypothetical protein
MRAETGKTEVDFLKTELDSCFTFASLAETEFKIGHREAAERSLAHAQKAYGTLGRFLSDPKFAKHLPAQAKQELAARLGDVHALLNNVRQLMGRPQKRFETGVAVCA